MINSVELCAQNGWWVVSSITAHQRLPSTCHIGTACKLAFLTLGTYQLFTSLAPLVQYLTEFTMATLHLISKYYSVIDTLILGFGGIR